MSTSGTLVGVPLVFVLARFFAMVSKIACLAV